MTHDYSHGFYGLPNIANKNSIKSKNFRYKRLNSLLILLNVDS